MTSTLTDLDLINDGLMSDYARNAFGKDVEPGDTLTGEIVSVTRRQRYNEDGEPLHWVGRKPALSPDGSRRPVIDSMLIVQTDVFIDEDDDDLLALWLDQSVRKALRTAVHKSGASGLEIGGRIEDFAYVGPAQTGSGRVYNGGTYQPPAS